MEKPVDARDADDEPPKYRIFVNVVAPIMFMLVVSIAALVRM